MNEKSEDRGTRVPDEEDAHEREARRDEESGRRHGVFGPGGRTIHDAMKSGAIEPDPPKDD